MTVPITPLKPEELTTLPDSGFGALETERGNLPLAAVDVEVRVSGLTAGVEVAQEFRNPHAVSLEATYVFPLPPRAAVTAFRMEADGHVVEGLLKEREEARADYDRALAEGRRAAIAEEDRPDVFAIRVGNIVPGETVTVRLSLSQPLPYEDGAAEFRFPLVVAPRYIPGAPLDGEQSGPGTSPDTDAVPDASRISPPVLLPGFPNPVKLSLTTTIDPAGLKLREIRSSLHTLDVDEQGEQVILRVQPGERLDRDFIVRLAFDASTALALSPDQDESGEGTFTLTVLPPADVTAAPRDRDVVLLLDRSGSMTGWKMVAARRAAARIVDTLTKADRFAVLSFDHVVERAFPEGLVDATDRNRYRAVEHLARLEARGGTEILGPVETALDLLATPGRDRVLVLVTDGQVGNEDQIVERVGARLDGGVRVHTVGIDRAVNAGFLGRLALLGSGRCELVESEDRLDEAMEHIHRRIGAPLVTDLTLTPEGLDVIPGTVTPLGSLFPGVPLTASGRYRGAAGSVTVRGLAEAGPWETSVPGTVTDAPAARAIWARAELRRLEDRYTIGARELEPVIVATSLRFGVLCRFTAFVAVDSRVVAEGGPEHRIIQPVEPPSGWDMPSGPLMAAAPMMAVAPAPHVGMARMRAESAADSALPFAAMPAPAGMPPAPKQGRGFAVRVPHPGKEQVRATDLSGVLPLLTEELTRLRAAESLPERDRRRYLADLASRLRVIVQMLAGHGELTALAGELEWAERPDADLALLWGKATALLGRLTGDAPRRPFWKRS